jgi:uncharacterized protein
MSLPALIVVLAHVSGQVSDPTNALAPETVTALDERVTAHRVATGVPVGVTVLDKLGGESFADVSDRAMDQFLMLYGGRTPGVLVVLAPADRKLRVAVSEELTDQLTSDEIARFTETATVAFKADNLGAGVLALVDAICAEVDAKPSRIRWTPVIVGSAGAGAAAWVLGLALKRRKRASGAVKSEGP